MRFRLLVLTLLALAFVPASPLVASASCAAPALQVVGQEAAAPVVLHRGQTVVVTGRYFVDGCNDTGTSYPGGIGCSSGNDSTPEIHGLRHVRLHLLHGVQKPTQVELGTVDADDSGRARWWVRIPEDAPTGASYLKSDLSEPLDVVVRR